MEIDQYISTIITKIPTEIPRPRGKSQATAYKGKDSSQNQKI